MVFASFAWANMFENAPMPISVTATATRQKTAAIKMRRLKKADCEVDFFFIDDLELAPSAAKPGYYVVGAACGVRFRSSAVCACRALNPAISHPPTRGRLAKNSTRADLDVCGRFEASLGVDTAAQRCPLCTAKPAAGGFCPNRFGAAAPLSVSNTAEGEIKG